MLDFFQHLTCASVRGENRGLSLVKQFKADEPFFFCCHYPKPRSCLSAQDSRGRHRKRNPSELRREEKTVPACEYYTLLALVNGMKIKLKVKSFMRIIEYNLMNSQRYLSLTVHRITFAAQPLVYQGRLCRSQSFCSMAVMSLVVARHAFSD